MSENKEKLIDLFNEQDLETSDRLTLQLVVTQKPTKGSSLEDPSDSKFTTKDARDLCSAWSAFEFAFESYRKVLVGNIVNTQGQRFMMVEWKRPPNLLPEQKQAMTAASRFVAVLMRFRDSYGSSAKKRIVLLKSYLRHVPAHFSLLREVMTMPTKDYKEITKQDAKDDEHTGQDESPITHGKHQFMLWFLVKALEQAQGNVVCGNKTFWEMIEEEIDYCDMRAPRYRMQKGIRQVMIIREKTMVEIEMTKKEKKKQPLSPKRKEDKKYRPASLITKAGSSSGPLPFSPADGVDIYDAIDQFDEELKENAGSRRIANQPLQYVVEGDPVPDQKNPKLVQKPAAGAEKKARAVEKKEEDEDAKQGDKNGPGRCDEQLVCGSCTVQNPTLAQECFFCHTPLGEWPSGSHRDKEEKKNLNTRHIEPMDPWVVDPTETSALQLPAFSSSAAAAVTDKAGTWTCETCTYENTLALQSCEICETAKPESKACSEKPWARRPAARGAFSPSSMRFGAESYSQTSSQSCFQDVPSDRHSIKDRILEACNQELSYSPELQAEISLACKQAYRENWQDIITLCKSNEARTFLENMRHESKVVHVSSPPFVQQDPRRREDEKRREDKKTEHRAQELHSACSPEMRKDDIELVLDLDKLNELIQDTISLEPMSKPVTLVESGHSYSKATLECMFRNGQRMCPQTRKPINRSLEELNEDKPLATVIEVLKNVIMEKGKITYKQIEQLISAIDDRITAASGEMPDGSQETILGKKWGDLIDLVRLSILAMMEQECHHFNLNQYNTLVKWVSNIDKNTQHMVRFVGGGKGKLVNDPKPGCLRAEIEGQQRIILQQQQRIKLLEDKVNKQAREINSLKLKVTVMKNTLTQYKEINQKVIQCLEEITPKIIGSRDCLEKITSDGLELKTQRSNVLNDVLNLQREIIDTVKKTIGRNWWQRFCTRAGLSWWCPKTKNSRAAECVAEMTGQSTDAVYSSLSREAKA